LLRAGWSGSKEPAARRGFFIDSIANDREEGAYRLDQCPRAWQLLALLAGVFSGPDAARHHPIDASSAMSRPVWKGFLRISLVTVPVRAYTVLETGEGEIHLHQLHRDCHNRVRYKKVCPVHGELSPDQIVMGYEFAKDQYVEIEESERKNARTKSDKSIEIDKFVPLDSIDPLYFEGRNYYLLPEGPGGSKPYALLKAALDAEGRCAVAQAALYGRDEVVVIRSREELLVLQTLNFASHLKPVEEFADEFSDEKPRSDELKLAKMLIESASAEKLDLSKYQDTYTDKLKELIEAKVDGHEMVSAPTDEAPISINLMDALRRSVAQAKGASKPKKRLATSHRDLTPSKRRRKSS
jgi:DNA end-binding protein Ku